MIERRRALFPSRNNKRKIVTRSEQFRSFIEFPKAKFEGVAGVSAPGGLLESSRQKQVLVYARCSTTQHDQRPEVQIEELRRYCNARGFHIYEEVVDHGFSGSTDKRPGLRRLQELVRSRKVDVVVVVKLDRLFRSVKHLISTLHEFSDLGIEFISLGEQLDFTTSSGKLLFHIIAAFAEFEKSLITERTRLGLAHAKSKGIKLGRPQKHDFAEIQRLHSLGKSLRQIQREIGCSIGSVYRAIEAVPKTPENNSSDSQVKTSAWRSAK